MWDYCMSGNELECRSSHHQLEAESFLQLFYKHKSTIGLLVTEQYTEQDILKVSNLVKEVGMERRKNTTYENPYEKLKVIQTNKMKQTNNCPHSEVGQDFLNNLFNNNNLFPSLPRSPLQPYKSSQDHCQPIKSYIL